MLKVFDTLSVETYLPQAEIVPSLQKLAREQVFEVEECFFLGANVAQGFTLADALTMEPTRTLVEAASSDRCVDWYLPRQRRHDPLQNLVQGILFACELRRNLSAYGRFRIVLTFESPGLTLDSEHTSVTVRFHKIRPDEDWWAPDLETPYNGNLAFFTDPNDVPDDELDLCSLLRGGK